MNDILGTKKLDYFSLHIDNERDWLYGAMLLGIHHISDDEAIDKAREYIAEKIQSLYNAKIESFTL